MEELLIKTDDKRVGKNNMRTKKIIVVLSITIFALVANSFLNVQAQSQGAIYFYSNTCSSCKNAEEYIEELESIINVDIQKYDITEKDNIVLLNSYCNYYHVTDDEYGMVPIVFIGDGYIYGAENIQDQLTEELLITKAKNTATREDVGVYKENKLEKKLSIPSIFCAGLVNGINPCSISLLLFLLTLIMMSKKKILQFGISFLVGKFITFFLMGTVLFQLIHKIDMTGIQKFTKVLFVVFGLFFVAINLYDFVQAKQKRFDKILLQLPKGIIKMNHSLIKRVKTVETSVLIIVGCILLGALIACGEFLCTGQIYLATIITMVQTGLSVSSLSLVYLLIYDIGFIIPLSLCLFVAYKGTSVLEISNKLVDKMPYIKMINAIVFLLYSIFYLIG